MIREGHKLPPELDFGILVSDKLDKQNRFDKHPDLIGNFSEILKTDETT